MAINFQKLDILAMPTLEKETDTNIETFKGSFIIKLHLLCRYDFKSLIRWIRLNFEKRITLSKDNGIYNYLN